MIPTFNMTPLPPLIFPWRKFRSVIVPAFWFICAVLSTTARPVNWPFVACLCVLTLMEAIVALLDLIMLKQQQALPPRRWHQGAGWLTLPYGFLVALLMVRVCILGSLDRASFGPKNTGGDNLGFEPGADTLGHVLQGLPAFFLMNWHPALKVDLQIIKFLLLTLMLLGYPTYNGIKRLVKTPDTFFYSSWYSNMSEWAMGLYLGYMLAVTVWDLYHWTQFQPDKEPVASEEPEQERLRIRSTNAWSFVPEYWAWIVSTLLFAVIQLGFWASIVTAEFDWQGVLLGLLTPALFLCVYSATFFLRRAFAVPVAPVPFVLTV